MSSMKIDYKNASSTDTIGPDGRYRPSAHRRSSKYDFHKSPSYGSSGNVDMTWLLKFWCEQVDKGIFSPRTMPWMISGKTYKLGVHGLHEEIQDFYNVMSPNREEHKMRLEVVERISHCIKDCWPEAVIEVFGSFRTGLYLPTSDIDLVVHGHWNQLPLKTLEKEIVRQGISDPRFTRVLDKAKVPIIKFVDKQTDIKIDISFNMSNGVCAAELVKKYRKEYPALAKLVLVLKQFLLQRDLNEVFNGGISSYSLILMVVSFLQMHPRENAGSENDNLGVLLIEFFELYGRHFNYNDVSIVVKNGGCYQPKDNLFQDSRRDVISIEDPLNTNNDVGRGSYETQFAQRAFEHAYLILNYSVESSNGLNNDPNQFSILGRLIQIPLKVANYREWIKESFPVLMTSKSTLTSLKNLDAKSIEQIPEFIPRHPPSSLSSTPSTSFIELDNLSSGDFDQLTESDQSTSPMPTERPTEMGPPTTARRDEHFRGENPFYHRDYRQQIRTQNHNDNVHHPYNNNWNGRFFNSYPHAYRGGSNTNFEGDYRRQSRIRQNSNHEIQTGRRPRQPKRPEIKRIRDGFKIYYEDKDRKKDGASSN